MSVDQQVLDQLELIYSPENLAKDNFFRELISVHAEGWISLKKFSYMKRFKVLIQGDLEAFERAASLSAEFEVNEDKTMLRKIPTTLSSDVQSNVASEGSEQPLSPTVNGSQEGNDGYTTVLNKRSIYVKGFTKDQEPKIADLQAFFEVFGRVLDVKLRKESDKSFKGSIFVQFESHGIAESVANEKLEYKGSPLMVMNKQAYIEMKAKEKDTSTWKQDIDAIQSHYVEFYGAAGMDSKDIRLALQSRTDVGRFEILPQKGCGILKLRRGMIPEEFLQSLENGKIGELAFRLATVESCRFARQKEQQFRKTQAQKRYGDAPERSRAPKTLKSAIAPPEQIIRTNAPPVVSAPRVKN